MRATLNRVAGPLGSVAFHLFVLALAVLLVGNIPDRVMEKVQVVHLADDDTKIIIDPPPDDPVDERVRSSGDRGTPADSK